MSDDGWLPVSPELPDDLALRAVKSYGGSVINVFGIAFDIYTGTSVPEAIFVGVTGALRRFLDLTRSGPVRFTHLVESARLGSHIVVIWSIVRLSSRIVFRLRGSSMGLAVAEDEISQVFMVGETRFSWDSISEISAIKVVTARLIGRQGPEVLVPGSAWRDRERQGAS